MDKSFILFLHLLGAVGMGFYLFFPLLAGRLGALSGEAKMGFAGVLRSLNRIGQFLLIVQLLTGGYMISQGSYTVAWIVAAIVLLVAVGAFTGIMGTQLKRIGQSAQGSPADESKVRTFSIIVFVLLLLLLILMYYNNII